MAQPASGAPGDLPLPFATARRLGCPGLFFAFYDVSPTFPLIGLFGDGGFVVRVVSINVIGFVLEPM
jgi:hypothetical protein